MSLILGIKLSLLNSQWWEIPFQRATLAGRGPRPMTVFASGAMRKGICRHPDPYKLNTNSRFTYKSAYN